MRSRITEKRAARNERYGGIMKEEKRENTRRKL